MIGPDARPTDPGAWLLDRIDAREQALTCQIEQTQAEIDMLTARLGQLSEAIEHLRISRKTLISLAEEDPTPIQPAAPPPAVPEHPAYQQILTVFAEAGWLPARPGPGQGNGPAPDAERHPERPRQAQTPGQPRHPCRDRAGIVHPATPVVRPAGLRPADLTQPHR
ncbi:hypothetical protein ACFSTC_63300 [Nonomuraea ferruginea]